MPSIRELRNGVRRSRGLALVAAALILFLQFAGAAHFHSYTWSSERQTRVQPSSDLEGCTVCLLALHSPGIASPPAVLFAFATHEEPVHALGRAAFSPARLRSQLVRGPPVSI